MSFFYLFMFEKNIKTKLVNNTLNFPIRTFCISLMLTFFFAIGLKWFIIDDDFVKLLPQHIPSKIIWDEIQEDFGASETMLIAFGNKGETVYRESIIDAIWDLTTTLENYKGIEEVISIKTKHRYF